MKLRSANHLLCLSYHVGLKRHPLRWASSGESIGVECTSCVHAACWWNPLEIKADSRRFRDILLSRDEGFLEALNQSRVVSYFDQFGISGESLHSVGALYRHTKETGHKVEGMSVGSAVGYFCTDCNVAECRWFKEDYEEGLLFQKVSTGISFENLLYLTPEFREKVLTIPSRFDRLVL